jgi:hypothetical protein
MFEVPAIISQHDTFKAMRITHPFSADLHPGLGTNISTRVLCVYRQYGMIMRGLSPSTSTTPALIKMYVHNH